MRRRAFLTASVGAVGFLTGCSAGGDTIIKHTTQSSIGATRERELEAGTTVELAVKVSDGMSVTGDVTRVSTGEVIAERTETSQGRWSTEAFEVPATETYEIGVKVGGSGSGSVRLREVE